MLHDRFPDLFRETPASSYLLWIRGKAVIVKHKKIEFFGKGIWIDRQTKSQDIEDDTWRALLREETRDYEI
jgi:hypothetical protein